MVAKYLLFDMDGISQYVKITDFTFPDVSAGPKLMYTYTPTQATDFDPKNGGNMYY
jgi:hypothetical protein